LILVLAQAGGIAVGEGEVGKAAKVAEDGVKEEEYWKGKQEEYHKKVQEKREEALRKAQEIERVNRLMDEEASGNFFNNWGFEWGSTDLEYPPIKPGDSEPLPPRAEEYDFVDLDDAYRTWTQDEVDQYWEDREEELEEMPDAIGPVTGPVVATALVEKGLVDMEITGAGTTTGLVFNLTNKTDEPILAVIPAGTPVVTDSEGYQPYQTSVIAPFFLEPGQTLTRECPAWCTDNDLEPAPADGSAKYTLQPSSFTPQQEKVRELILVADYMEDLHTFCGSVVEPEDFVQLPLPPDTDSVDEKALKNIPQFTSLSFNLSSALEFPGPMQFSLSTEDGILKHNISSKDGKEEEIVFTNPQGKVEVSVKPTDNPALLKFDITELSASADSFEVSGNSKGDINMVLGSPEKSTGFLNINTGEVNGTVCVNASGKKYKDPYPAAGTFTGMFDFPTKKLNMSFNGLSFEPVKLEKGPYQTSQPEKFWETVHLYTVWGETNKIGREELTELMTEQFSASYPKEKAEKLANMVAGEVIGKVHEVQEIQEELNNKEFDFSILDPTLKWHKTDGTQTESESTTTDGSDATASNGSEESIEVFNGPPEFNLTTETERGSSCECEDDNAHTGGISTVASECPYCPPDDPISQDMGKYSVYLHNGEFFLYEVDMEIPGRGFNWKLERKYRSGITFQGPLGHNWESNYNRRLFIEDGGDVLRMDGYGRSDRYELEGGTDIKHYKAPTGFYTNLINNQDGTFTERDRNGVKVLYSSPDKYGIARMSEMRDRNGNRMRFKYNYQGQLVRVVDTLGRPIDYIYNKSGLLTEVRDFINRSVKFEYDQNNDLIAVTSPTVTGMPNGNNFPQGKTTNYTYSSGFDGKILNHNLLTIKAPNEVASGGAPRVQVEYDNDPDSPDIDRVLYQIIGGINAPATFTNGKIAFLHDKGVPAGGTISYEYETLANVSTGDFSTAARQTTVIDRNRNMTEYRYNRLGNIVRIREFTNRDVRSSDPEFFETRFEYNKDGEMVRRSKPGGDLVENSFDNENADRFQQGNQQMNILVPDPDGGGDQKFIKSTYTHEPIYNQLRTEIDPRGNDPSYVPPNGGQASPKRYTTTYIFDYQEGNNFNVLANELGVSKERVKQLLTDAGIPMGLGDINGDGRTDQIAGNVIKVSYPTVSLLAGSNMVKIEGGTEQPIVELRVYNDFGQITKEVDPEGNVTIYEYYAGNDPDGDGNNLIPDLSSSPSGYLKMMVRDAENNPARNARTDSKPAKISRYYFYDRSGNIIKEIDGRGIATEYKVNQLNQVVQTIRAGDNTEALNSTLEPKGSETDTGLISFRYIENTFYDFNDNIIHRQTEDRGNTRNVGDNNKDRSTSFVDHEFKYGILDNQIEMLNEVSDSEDLITRYRYDANENQVLIIQPEGNAISSVCDERDLLYQRINGADSPPAQVLLASDDPVNYDVRGGKYSIITYHYDLNKKIIETVDAHDTDGSIANNSRLGGVGDRTRFIYDGFDRQTSVVDSLGNQSVTQYDPAGNVVRVSLFGPVDGEGPISDGPDDLSMPVSSLGIIQANNLVNKNLLQANETLYDEIGRKFQTDQVLFVNAIPTANIPDVKDGALDIGKNNLAPNDNQNISGVTGINIIGRVTTRTEYDRSSRVTFTVEDDGDTTRTFYDGINRIIKTVDPESNIVETAYDDNNNVIEVKETDISQVAGIKEEVFLATYFYDSLNRIYRSVDNLGQTFDYRYDSHDNLVAMSDAQGPVTDKTVKRRAFTDGAKTVNRINGFGNVTIYSYDGISRKLQEDVILTASGEGDGVNIGATIEGIKTTTSTPDLSQGGGDGLITFSYDWDKNSLLTSLTDDNGNQTQYTYDNLNRKITETKGISVSPKLADRDDPDTTITYEYDQDDNVIRKTDENGSVINFDFDAINRKIESNVTRASGVIGTTKETYEYDGLSRLTRASDNNDPDTTDDDSIITYTYDSLSRVIEETQKIGELSSKTVASSWRADNLKACCTYPNNRIVENTYDGLDRLNTISDKDAANVIVDYDYIGKWRVAKRDFPENGTHMTYLNDDGGTDVGYDGLRRPVKLRHLGSDKSTIVGFTHTYDRMNNKLNEEKLHDSANSEEYRYDSAYRLISFKFPNAGAIASIYSDWMLDGVGNWKQVDNETRKHSSINEIIELNNDFSTVIISDNNGNETDDGTFLFKWDYRNRLRKVTRKSDEVIIAVYSYDVKNRRIRKDVTNSDTLNSTTDFYYDGWQVLEERDVNDILIQQYIYGIYIDEPLVLNRNMDSNTSAIDSGDQELFYHQNTLHSVIALTDVNGAVVEGYQYSAYGRQTVILPGSDGVVDFSGNDIFVAGDTSQLNNQYMFTGRRLDAETGLYYYRNRYMNSEQGRFISRDTIDYSKTLEIYEYVNSSPVMKTDPSGEIAPVIVAAAAIVGVVAACALPFHLHALSTYGNKSDKWRHCWVSCEMAKTCGPVVTELAGLGKEIRDRAVAAFCDIFPESSMCQGGHGDFFDSIGDLVANQKCIAWESAFTGFICRLWRQSCKCCCDAEGL